MKKGDFIRIGYLTLIILFVSSSIRAQKMPDTCNELYLKFTRSIESSNLADLESVMCKSTMVKMKNEALSLGMEYPKDFFDGMKMALLEFKNFRYLQHKKEGPTTNVYYMYGENNAQSNIVTICLVEEDNQFRIEQFKMRDAKDFIIHLKNKDYSFLELAEFRPSGIVPEVPKEVDQVDYIANVDVVAYGYHVKVSVNGFWQDDVTNKAKSGVLIGGIKKGENTIEIQVEKKDPSEQDNPAVSIRALMNGEEKEVFVIYEEMSGTVTRKFTVQ